MTVEKRIEKLAKLDICSNCLYPGHHLMMACCGSTCKYCSQKHNTMLHKEQPKGSHTTLTSTQHSSVLLSTALVTVVGSENELYTARALLDNGSTACYLSKHLCSKLNLTLENFQASVSGVNQQYSNIFHRRNIQIKSLHNSYTSNISRLVLDNI